MTSRLNVAASSRDLRDLVYGSTGTFRHLDLSQVRLAQGNLDDFLLAYQINQVSGELTDDQ